MACRSVSIVVPVTDAVATTVSGVLNSTAYAVVTTMSVAGANLDEGDSVLSEHSGVDELLGDQAACGMDLLAPFLDSAEGPLSSSVGGFVLLPFPVNANSSVSSAFTPFGGDSVHSHSLDRCSAAVTVPTACLEGARDELTVGLQENDASAVACVTIPLVTCSWGYLITLSLKIHLGPLHVQQIAEREECDRSCNYCRHDTGCSI